MSKHQGRFVWYELATTDVKAALDFYRNVIGWQVDFYEGAGMPYNILKADGSGMGIGGVFELPEEARRNGAPPHWTAYVHADDVDALTKKAISLGGSSCVPPADIPTVGRFSVIADPHGAMIALLKPLGPETEEETEMPPPKHFCWRELMAGDLEKDFAFYAALFGWEKQDAMPMPNGVYQLYGRNGVMLGGMMTKPQGYPYPPHWLYYVAVEDLDDAIVRTKKHGGKVMMDPMEVPGGTRVVQCIDPQGAMFALNGK